MTNLFNGFTPAQVKGAFNVVLAVTETIREAGSIPEGTLYAALMTQGMDHHTFETMMRTILNTGLVKKSPACLLTWAGPLKGVRA